MHSHEELRHILLEILRAGLLRIRAFGNSGLSDACSLEADHIHNLPMLVQTLNWDELLFYFNVERPAFLSRTEADTEDFRPFWNKLEKQLQVEQAVTTAN